MKVEEDNVNRTKLFVIAGSFALVSVPFYITGYNALANILMLVALGAPFNSFILTPGVKWFQNVFLPLLENVYSRTIRFALK
jgi:multidrug efflux pump